MSVKVQVIEGGDSDAPSGAVLFQGDEAAARRYLDDTDCAYDYHYGVALVADDGRVDWGHGWPGKE